MIKKYLLLSGLTLLGFSPFKSLANDLYLPILIDYYMDDAPSMHQGYINLPHRSDTGDFRLDWRVEGYESNYTLEQSVDTGIEWQVVYQGNNNYFDVSTSHSATYYYRVRACQTKSLCTHFVYSRSILVNALSEAPKNIAATQQGSQVQVSWSPTSINSLQNINLKPISRFLSALTGKSTGIEYEVYESTNSSDFVYLSKTNEQQIQLAKPNDATTRYKVRACSPESSQCSKYSNESNGVGGILAPQNVSALLTLNPDSTPIYPTSSIKVTWSKAPSDADKVWYSVERSVNSGTWQVIEQIDGLEYIDLAPAQGQVAYRVRSCDPTKCYEVSKSTLPIDVPRNTKCDQALGRLEVYQSSSGLYMKRESTQFHSKVIPGVLMIPYASYPIVKQQYWKITRVDNAEGYQVNSVTDGEFAAANKVKLESPLQCSVNSTTNEVRIAIQADTNSAITSWSAAITTVDPYADNYFSISNAIALMLDGNTLRWPSVDNAANYILQGANCTSCSRAPDVNWQTISTFSKAIHYYQVTSGEYKSFRVKACFEKGHCTPWSNIVTIKPKKQIIFIHTDLLGNPVVESQ
ncbi:hypothetical protein A7985_24240 [Pseudoalteromonas luteoviolacea]|uniref:Fibronectin type-III domain-containing protein n=1 Tax=Pseudoalteromonas luteoviolacea TaxID=43657 RepID=A0A1C0TJ75_9GAMM|nr:hypothetical protein [Pseudoalteromonas luteoviolacea]OCQ18322.1 hypothetical protein A7985_24240 [Pseudoalteromonas luteoviolacea]